MQHLLEPFGVPVVDELSYNCARKQQDTSTYTTGLFPSSPLPPLSYYWVTPFLIFTVCLMAGMSAVLMAPALMG